MAKTMKSAARSQTLWMCGILHAFTHIFHVALIPLYLLIQSDLGLASVEEATLLMTVMMAAYYLPSYFIGALGDRSDRKRLLGWGLAINSLGYIGLALAPNYTAALASVIVSGLGGSCFHPAATALVASLYPVGTGRALGLVGVGASVGFCLGPLYSGWRAGMAGWRAPVLELGLCGLGMALVFAWLARGEAAVKRPPRPPGPPVFPALSLWIIFLLTSLAFSLRDFAGGGMASLSSLFLQKARGFDPQITGLALSCIYIVSAISNPLFGGWSDQARIRWTGGVLSAAALMVVLFPRVPSSWSIPVLALYGFFFMASFPMVEAALMESVPDAVRGRVFGLFITIGGLIGNLSHWSVGDRVKKLAEHAANPSHYYALYLGLGGLTLASIAGLAGLRALRVREEAQTGSLAGSDQLGQRPAGGKSPG